MVDCIPGPRNLWLLLCDTAVPPTKCKVNSHLDFLLVTYLTHELLADMQAKA